MADVKISALPLASTPLAGTEVLPIVQSATTDQVSVANLTAGRAVSAASLTLTTTPLAVGSGGTGTSTAFTAGSVVFAGTSGVYSQNNSQLFWDNMNNRLGVGAASPSYKLDVNSPSNYVGRFQNSTNQALFLYSGSNLSGIVGESSGQNGFFLNSASNLAQIYTGGALCLTADASGNLGLGVTPSAWASPFTKAFDIGSTGAIATTTNSLRFANNAYYGSSGWTYKNTASAAHYDIINNEHSWYNAPSGTAGNPITFTQAMTLDASSNLVIGGTTANARLDVQGGSLRVNEDGAGTKVITLRSNYASVGPAINVTTNDPLLFLTNNTERMRIDASGNVIINTAAIATTATDGFLYVPTCAGTPTGTPTTYTGRAPIVVNTTNNKLYFYSGGAWRDAGP